jgi:mRNA interferase MazF
MRISVAGPGIRRAEIWWTDLDDTVGGEIRKSRPAVIVSNDDSNAILNRVQVLPVTSRVRRVYPSEALIRINGIANKAMADQIATADKKRIHRRIGRVSGDEMKAIEKAIRTQLAL